MKFKKLVSTAVCTALMLAAAADIWAIPARADDVVDLSEKYITLIPTDDTTIRADQKDINFGTVTNLTMDVRNGSRRYGLLHFDGSELSAEFDSAAKIVFRFYGGNAERCRRLILYPLYGSHKNFNENTLTWSIATGIVQDGVALPDYLENPYITPTPPSDAKWHEIDVTDYVKSQGDGIYSFKTWTQDEGTSVYSTVLRSKESQSFEPHLKVYTDVDFVTAEAAQDIVSGINLSALTGDITLPNSWQYPYAACDPCELEWSSADASVIDFHDDGTSVTGSVCERPAANAAEDVTTLVCLKIKYRKKVLVREIYARVLRENEICAAEDTYVAGGSYSDRNYGNEQTLLCGYTPIEEFQRDIYLKLSGIDSFKALNASRYIFRIYPDNTRAVQTGSVTLSVYDGEVDGVEQRTGGGFSHLLFTRPTEIIIKPSVWVDIDITDILEGITSDSCLLKLSSAKDEITFFSSESQYPPIAIALDSTHEPLFNAAQALTSELTINAAAVDGDFVLPILQDGYDVTWQSSDPAALYVDAGTAYVERMHYDYGDRTVMLTAAVSDGINTFYKDFFIRVRRLDPGGVNGRRELRDPNKMTDAELFGEWSDKENSWTVTPVLQYDTISGLSEVCHYAKKGNYILAKEALLQYYQNRDGRLDYPVELSASYSLGTRLVTEKIIGNQSVDAAFSIGRELRWNEIEIAPSKGVQASYMLFDRSKDGSRAVLYSRESEYAPYLKVVTSSTTHYFESSADTYVRGGQYMDTSYGKEHMLFVHEEDSPFGDYTERTFINFDLSGFKKTESIKSISLMVYGMKIGGEDDVMNLLICPSPLLEYMDENTTAWSSHTPGMFNFRDTVYDWSAPYGSESEWINLLGRQNANTSMVSYYLATGDEAYAFTPLENLIGIHTYQDAGHPRALDTAWRVPNLLAPMFGLMDNQYMTAEVFTALIKYSYQMMIFLSGSTASVVNQKNAINTGFTQLVTYFPELHGNDFYEQSKARQGEMITKLSYADGAYLEGTSGYISGVLDEQIETVKMFDKSGIEYDREAYLTSIGMLAKYYGNITMPNGYIVPFGDAGRTKTAANLKNYADFLQDDELLFYATLGDEGTEPSHTSILYPYKKSAVMRSGWDSNALFAHINADTVASHGHPDKLHMDVYAYGQSLLIDAGNGGGYNPISPAGYVRTETYAHNTVEVNGEAQGIVASTGMDMTTNNSFDFLEGYTDGNAGVRHTRKIFFLRKGFWIVTDFLEPEDKEAQNSYKQLWHPDNNANLQVDTETGIARTNFAGKANLQIIPADPEKLETFVDQSYIRSERLVNLMEDYVYYYQEGKGNTTFDTLLFPTRAAESIDASIERLALSDGASSNTATALRIGYDGKEGVYYISHEEQPKDRSFGNYTFDGELAYVERAGNGDITAISVLNGSLLSLNGGGALFESEDEVGDIGIDWSGGDIQISTSAGLYSNIRIFAPKAVESVSVDGVYQKFIRSGDYILLQSSKLMVDAQTQGVRKTYTFTEAVEKVIAVGSGSETKNVVLTIAAGTTVSGGLDWDGSIAFDALNGSELLISLTGGGSVLSFSTPVTIAVPFYTGSGAYYTARGGKTSFTNTAGLTADTAALTDNGGSLTISSMISGSFTFTTLRGANSTAGAGPFVQNGSAGGGNGGGVTTPVDPIVTPDDTSVFNDIIGHWAREDIEYLYEKGIVNGDGNGSFIPDGYVTRAEFVAMITRAFAVPAAEYAGEFTDISGEQWYADIAAASKKEGLILGYEDSSFRPNNNISREEMAKIAVFAYTRYVDQSPIEGGTLEGFNDRGDISEWARGCVGQAAAIGLVRGDAQGNYNPKSYLTRAEAATVISRLSKINIRED